MTLIKKYVITTIGGNNRSYKKNIIELKCNQCEKLYECPDKYKNRAIKSELHFCNIVCSQLSFSNGILRKKAIETILERYDGYYVKTDKFINEQKELCLSLYGVKSRLESAIILEKIKATNIEKFGRPTFAGSKKHVESCDFIDISRKAWKTKIKNGTCSKSAPEEKFYQILINFFDLTDIKRQAPLLRQWIDFHICSANIYIQVDGVYWHGLNRDLDIIKLGKTSQDQKIYKQILRDQKLNEYCKFNKIKLIRFTDKEILQKTEREIYATIRTFM